VLKAEKVCENVLIAIFAVQMQFFFAVQMIHFWCAGKKFLSVQYKLLPPFGVSFCLLMVQVLPPYGASFAALWQEFLRLLVGVLPSYVKFLTQSTKVCCRFF